MRLPAPVRFLSTGLVAALLLATPTASAIAQDKKQADKAEQAQRAEAQSLVTLVDDLTSGKSPQSSLPFKWEQNHFIKAQADKTYVPFTLAFEPGAVTTTGVGVYLRVTKKGAAPEPPPADTGKKKDKDKDKAADARTQYPFEDLFFIDLPAAPAGQPQRLRRAFAVPPGDYDIYVAVKERAGSSAPATSATSTAAPGAAAAGGSLKTGVFKQDLTVPDLSSGLTTSSIIVAERVEVLQTPLPTDQQAINPYTFGQMKITPAAETKFSKKGELSIIFWIYGAGSDPATKKPDVTIDFKFNRKNGDNFEYFNKTEPQQLNAQTLPPNFDLAAGHQLPGSLAVPLASFPEGEYRLDIELTDKTAGKSLKRDVTFTVVP